MTIVGGTPVTDDSEDEFKSDASATTPESNKSDPKRDGKTPHGVADLRSSGDSR